MHWVLLLLNKDNSQSHEKRPGVTVRRAVFFYNCTHTPGFSGFLYNTVVHARVFLTDFDLLNPLQMETVTSLKALYKIVDVSQLTAALHGSFQYNHCDWLQIHQVHYWASNLIPTSIIHKNYDVYYIYCSKIYIILLYYILYYFIFIPY